MRDLLPDDMQRFRHIEDAFRDCSSKWGYQEIRTPTLEYLYLFTATGTLLPSMLGKVYSFLDWDGWSGERVVLRPDGTIPVARLYIDNLSKQETAKLFYVTNIFAFEKTGEGREKWQCGAEFLGGATPMADAEIILLAEEVMHRLGLGQVELHISHAGLVKEAIKELKLDPGEEAKLTSCVLEGDWQALLLAADSCQLSAISRILSLLLSFKGKSSGFLQNVEALAPQSSPGFNSNLEDFINTVSLLDSLNCNYEIDIKAIRGFEYYTGICFQFFAEGNKIGSGGRYDNLIPLMSGRGIPACGFALYIEPILSLIADSCQLSAVKESGVLIKAEELTQEVAKTCFTLAQSLRTSGHIAELDFAGREGSEYRWTISVSGRKPSPFTLLDHKQEQRRNVSSIAEVLNYIK